MCALVTGVQTCALPIITCIQGKTMALERADAPSNMLILRNLMLCYQSIMFNYTSMDLRQLQVFHTVMETRSASRAARILGVSQPAESTLRKRLEERLGIELFARERNPLRPEHR